MEKEPRPTTAQPLQPSPPPSPPAPSPPLTRLQVGQHPVGVCDLQHVRRAGHQPAQRLEAHVGGLELKALLRVQGFRFGCRCRVQGLEGSGEKQGFWKCPGWLQARPGTQTPTCGCDARRCKKVRGHKVVSPSDWRCRTHSHPELRLVARGQGLMQRRTVHVGRCLCGQNTATPARPLPSTHTHTPWTAPPLHPPCLWHLLGDLLRAVHGAQVHPLLLCQHPRVKDVLQVWVGVL